MELEFPLDLVGAILLVVVGSSVFVVFTGGGSCGVEIDGAVCQELDDGTEEHHKDNRELKDNKKKTSQKNESNVKQN